MSTIFAIMFISVKVLARKPSDMFAISAPVTSASRCRSPQASAPDQRPNTTPATVAMPTANPAGSQGGSRVRNPATTGKSRTNQRLPTMTALRPTTRGEGTRGSPTWICPFSGGSGKSTGRVGPQPTGAADSQALGNNRGQAIALNGIGWCLSPLGEHESAVAPCRQSLVLFGQLGDRLGEATVQDSLGHHLPPARPPRPSHRLLPGGAQTAQGARHHGSAGGHPRTPRRNSTRGRRRRRGAGRLEAGPHHFHRPRSRRRRQRP